VLAAVLTPYQFYGEYCQRPTLHTTPC